MNLFAVAALIFITGASTVTPSPTPQKRVEARPHGSIRVLNDGGSFGLECLPATGTDAGCLSAGPQTIAGRKFFPGGVIADTVIRSDGGSVALEYSGTGAISIVGPVISCTPAAVATTGCMTSGYQTIGGRKDFAAAITVNNTTDPNGVALYSQGDIWLTGSMRAASNGATLALFGRATGNAAPEVGVYSTNYRDAGPILNLYDSAGASVFGVDVLGNVKLSQPSFNFSGISGYSQFIDNTGVGGHESATTTAGQGFIIAGRFDDPADPAGPFIAADGGMAPDGGYWSFGGNHGEVTVTSTFRRYAGLLQDWRNKEGLGALTDVRAFIDYNGGLGQLHGLTLAQFGVCPAYAVIMATGQQNAYGQQKTVLMYANDKNAWYFCNGTEWTEVAAVHGRQALGTCDATREGHTRADVIAGSTTTGKRTKLCLCTSDGTSVYAWQNLGTGTLGNTTECGTE